MRRQKPVRVPLLATKLLKKALKALRLFRVKIYSVFSQNSNKHTEFSEKFSAFPKALWFRLPRKSNLIMHIFPHDLCRLKNVVLLGNCLWSCGIGYCCWIIEKGGSFAVCFSLKSSRLERHVYNRTNICGAMCQLTTF